MHPTKPSDIHTHTHTHTNTATGAFEVTYDGMVVFSKLETGRLPTGDEILSGLRALGVE